MTRDEAAEYGRRVAREKREWIADQRKAYLAGWGINLFGVWAPPPYVGRSDHDPCQIDLPPIRWEKGRLTLLERGCECTLGEAVDLYDAYRSGLSGRECEGGGVE